MRNNLQTPLTLAAVAAMVSLFKVGAQGAGSPAELPPVSAELTEKIAAAIPDKPTVVPAKPRKILAMWKCDGFYHGVIPVANKAIELLGEKTGAFSVEFTNDKSFFNDEKLAQFDAVLLNNTTNLKLDDSQKQALLSFVRGGKGLIGVHGASDNFADWPEGAEMVGGIFSGHPWGAEGTWAVRIEEPGHPINRAFKGQGFKIRDEIYQFKAPYSREKLRILLTLDLTDEATAKPKGARADRDYAISWVRKVGEGRVFYCSLGHNNEVFFTPAVLEHYLDGMQYALGDLEADATPSASK